MTLVVCGLSAGAQLPLDPNTPDAQRDKISIDWEADYETSAAEEVTWGGTFQIKSGTGQYEGIEGSGEISGYFFCFGGCEEGPFQDVQFALVGTYQSPAIPSPETTG